MKTSPVISEYYIILRYSEQLLIRAEARAQLGKIREAQNDINLVRVRAGLNNTLAFTTIDLLHAIEQEKRTEFFCEWGHRWFDLKRWGKADVTLGMEKGNNWQSTDVLYPIPLLEIQRNGALTQNPGY